MKHYQPDIMTFSRDEQMVILTQAATIFREHAEILKIRRHRTNAAFHAKALMQSYNGAVESARTLSGFLLTVKPSITKRGSSHETTEQDVAVSVRAVASARVPDPHGI